MRMLSLFALSALLAAPLFCEDGGEEHARKYISPGKIDGGYLFDEKGRPIDPSSSERKGEKKKAGAKNKKKKKLTKKPGKKRPKNFKGPKDMPSESAGEGEAGVSPDSEAAPESEPSNEAPKNDGAVKLEDDSDSSVDPEGEVH